MINIIRNIVDTDHENIMQFKTYAMKIAIISESRTQNKHTILLTSPLISSGNSIDSTPVFTFQYFVGSKHIKDKNMERIVDTIGKRKTIPLPE